MSQPRQNESRNSKGKSQRSRLDGMKCRMLRAPLRDSSISMTCQPGNQDQTISGSNTREHDPQSMAEIYPFSTAPTLPPTSRPSAENWSSTAPLYNSSTNDSPSHAVEGKLRRLAVEHPDGLAFIDDFLDAYLNDLTTIESDDLRQPAGTDTMKSRALRIAWQQNQPAPGWNSRVELQNPRTPAVPASLDLTLEEYYAAAALVGILGAQQHEPDMEWASNWAHQMGATMAAESRKRRKKRGR